MDFHLNVCIILVIALVLMDFSKLGGLCANIGYGELVVVIW